MKQLTTAVPTALLLLALLYILYLTQCNPPRPCPPVANRIVKEYSKSKPKTDTIYRPGDTIRISKTIKIKGKDSLVFVPVQVIKEVPTKIDTQAVIRNYFSMRIQSDSFKSKGVLVKVVDTVQQNEITGRLWNVEIEQSPIQRKRQFYFGAEVYTSTFMNKGLSTEFISSGQIGLGYINRKGEHLKLGLMRTGGRWHQGLGFYHTF